MPRKARLQNFKETCKDQLLLVL